MIAALRGWTGRFESVVAPLDDDWEDAKAESLRRLAATRCREVPNPGALVWAREYLLELFPEDWEEIDNRWSAREIVDFAASLIF